MFKFSDSVSMEPLIFRLIQNGSNGRGGSRMYGIGNIFFKIINVI